MLLVSSMSQSQDTGLSQEEYLERLLQGQNQYQQKFQHQSSGNRKPNGKGESSNGNSNSNSSSHLNNESLFIGRTSNPSFSSGNNGINNSPNMAFSNTIGIGMNQQQQFQQQQQNRMMNFLQERQQQQQFMTGGLIGGPSDIPSNLSIAGLPSNVGNGIGSGLSQNWMDGLNLGAPLPATVAGNGASLYPIEQDLLMNTQRFPLVGNAMGGNRLPMNAENKGPITDNPLASLLGGLSPYCMPQNLASAQASLNSEQTPSSKALSDMLLSKQAQAALLQAAQARLPRTMRLPCGARGMKTDHNSTTAYFDVPENARHGQHLLCSHSVCRAAGVKFRYCAYCKKPVTKQNFRSRHLHADLDPNSKDKNKNKHKKKDEKEVEPKKTNGSTKRKAATNEKASTEPSVENLGKLITDDDKDSIESFEGLDANDDGEVAESKVERPSKARKLANFDGGKNN